MKPLHNIRRFSETIYTTSEPGAARVSAWGPALASRVFGGVPELGLCIACAKQHSKRGGEREVY